MYRHLIADRQVVAVAPVSTVILSAQNVRGAEGYMTIEIINDDATQTIQAGYQKSQTATGPWATAGYEGFVDILPGQTRMETVDVRYLEYIRFSATASGAGANVRISVSLFTP